MDLKIGNVLYHRSNLDREWEIVAVGPKHVTLFCEENQYNQFETVDINELADYYTDNKDLILLEIARSEIENLKYKIEHFNKLLFTKKNEVSALTEKLKNVKG